MMGKQPKLMNYSRMKDILGPHYAQIHDHSYISNELGIVYGDPRIFMLVIGQTQPPFVIDDYRLGVLVNGEIHVNINLVERHITPGTLVFLGPGTIISPISFSGKIELYGLGLFADFPMPFTTIQMPSAFNGQVRDFQIKAGESDIVTARHMIDTIWHVVRQPDYNRQTISSLVAAVMHHYDGIYRQHIDLLKESQSREQTIFDRFIYLVNQYATREHHISFYADRMCLTQRYLGTVVRQASGTTAKEWIDRALVEHIKIELKHTDKSIVQISEEMDFPNPSFFSKYFKRLTGHTPLEFKQSK
ncbi:MAG: AraC family transcriptional regulator [Prevotella sp.]|nr:AraC family transcriptional regulator [Prevotella sp.]